MDTTDGFIRLARNLQAGDIDFEKCPNSDEDQSDVDWGKLITEKPLLEANSVSSRVFDRILGKSGMHKVVIDLDMDAALWETTTPGHHHLIIDHEMTWETYARLLTALRDAGLIEKGYWHASMDRKASWIRTPWTKK
jgi:hypothetical protein